MSLNNWTLCSSLFLHHLIPFPLWPQEQCDEWAFFKKTFKYSSAPKLLHEKLRLYHSQSAHFHVGLFQIQPPLISEGEGCCYSAYSFMHWGKVCNPIVWNKGNCVERSPLLCCILWNCHFLVSSQLKGSHIVVEFNRKDRLGVIDEGMKFRVLIWGAVWFWPGAE